MSDDELTAWIAEHVMGWEKKIDGFPPRYPNQDQTHVTRFWYPLDSWDDVMMVREPMRQKGWPLFALGDNIGGGVTASFFKQSAGAKDWYSHEFTPKDDRSDKAQRRAILLAAKQAIESE